MKIIFSLLLLVPLAGCGVETASTAATAAAMKKQELEQGRNTYDRAKQKIGAAVELQQQSVQQNDPEK
ncbi:MAG TPA: hypothetical protein VFX09_04375 [Burkholderiales bacterium]|nr:hypothetical protein [Burkholderiales bacterium]